MTIEMTIEEIVREGLKEMGRLKWTDIATDLRRRISGGEDGRQPLLTALCESEEGVRPDAVVEARDA